MKSWHGGVLLQRGIADEIAYKDFIFNDTDYRLLQAMIAEINALGYDVHYLAEIDEFRLPKSGEIIKKYINEYISEATRAYLIPQMVIDKVDDCAKLVLDLYLHFKDSDEYISKPKKPAPAHIYVRYDNAFKRLKPKRLKNQLIKLVSNPRDAFYLPFTVRMLASWKQEDVKYILMSYLDGSSITVRSLPRFFCTTRAISDKQKEAARQFPCLLDCKHSTVPTTLLAEWSKRGFPRLVPHQE